MQINLIWLIMGCFIGKLIADKIIRLVHKQKFNEMMQKYELIAKIIGEPNNPKIFFRRNKC
jgi:hypothetical protein